MNAEQLFAASVGGGGSATRGPRLPSEPNLLCACNARVLTRAFATG